MATWPFKRDLNPAFGDGIQCLPGSWLNQSEQYWGWPHLGLDNLIGLMLIGVASAFGGYLFIKYILEKKPDFYEDDINSIGVDDLHPPRN